MGACWLSLTFRDVKLVAFFVKKQQEQRLYYFVLCMTISNQLLLWTKCSYGDEQNSLPLQMSFENIRQWYEDVKLYCREDCSFTLIGNKCDLERSVTEDQAQVSR